MNKRRVSNTLTLLILFPAVAFTCSLSVLADGSAPAPKPPPELATRIQEITDAVLEHHIDPPARQQMILSGIKALYQAAGVPVPAGLSRHVSAMATPEQIAVFLAEVWPKSTAKPAAAEPLEEVLLRGLVRDIPGGAQLIAAKERKVAEQLEGNRYVGIHIALGMDDREKRTKIAEVFEGGPADRAGVKKDDLLEAVDGADTKGMPLTAVVDRIRGEEGTNVTIQVRQPKESKSRMITITRGQHPHPTIEGIRKNSSGDWKVRFDGPDPISYLKITEIGASTPHELRKLATRLESEGIRALVLDLRGRLSGNAVHPAVLLADCLLDRGRIGCVRTARGQTAYQAESDALFRGWPIAVLVDSGTSGTAEWLAAALQDNHRAILVGTPTYSTLRPGGAVVRSTISVGNGAWSITMTTGQLEHGDGRPLSDPLADATVAFDPGDVPIMLPNRAIRRPKLEEIKTGVKPDIMVNPNGSDARTNPRPRTSEPAEAALQSMQQALRGPKASASDQSVAKALQWLKESLEKGTPPVS